MPYASNDKLPASVRSALDSKGQGIFRNTVNSVLEDGGSEASAFRQAWGAVKNAGYEKTEDGRWVEKTSPTSSSVHTDGAINRERRLRKELTGKIRTSLQNKVKEHNEKHGDNSSKKVTLSMLETVFNRGVGAYRTNPSSVRPNVSSSEQWGIARVNSFLKDIVEEKVVEGGKHDTDLMPKGNKLSTKKVEKAEYQGREVDLDKPFRLPSGSSKKFGVYVKDGDKTKKVTFGSPDMEIRRDDPDARANFRARHNCDTATDKTSARYWSCRMWEADTTVSELTKYQMSNDTFSMPIEAMTRSIDLGLDGEIHVHSGENGQAVYMPGATHEEYLDRMAEIAGIEENDEEETPLEIAVRSIIRETIGKSVEGQMTDEIQGVIVKADDEQRMVYGWASVATENGQSVVDTQGDILKMDILEKSATAFMLDARIAKAMHDGAGIGEVVHSLPLGSELAKSLGIASPREGWIIGMKIHDDAVWKRVKDGELRAFSIGGKGVRQDVA